MRPNIRQADRDALDDHDLVGDVVMVRSSGDPSLHTVLGVPLFSFLAALPRVPGGLGVGQDG